ncbi:hypothetical protein DPEC_G00182800 [Dallia pectoralis]|uniref:Uncharacterized protein n=1 Tax=Dallia pectoralis TaxID=75939 RepID=A0ACC2GAC5_DALPE|nr:hypothetical protein DPEC_G00182800 [Dallia pectoralis]
MRQTSTPPPAEPRQPPPPTGRAPLIGGGGSLSAWPRAVLSQISPRTGPGSMPITANCRARCLRCGQSSAWDGSSGGGPVTRRIFLSDGLPWKTPASNDRDTAPGISGRQKSRLSFCSSESVYCRDVSAGLNGDSDTDP